MGNFEGFLKNAIKFPTQTIKSFKQKEQCGHTKEGGANSMFIPNTVI